MSWLMLLLGLLLVLGTAFFVAVEFSLVALDSTSVKKAIDEGDTKARPLYKALKSLSTQLSAVQLGITITTLLTGYVIEPAFSALLGPVLLGWGVPQAAAGAISLVVAMVVATLLSMILGELIPKNMAIADPYRIGRALARPQLIFTAVFKPVVMGLNGFSNWVLGLFGIEAKEELSGARTPAELQSLLARSAQQGTMDAKTAKFLARTLSFSERTAADVMTPRIKVEMIEDEAPLPALIDLARRTGFSRFLVIGEDADDVLGAVHVKKAVSVPRERRDELVAGTIMQDVIRVPETVQLDDLIGELREAPLQIAVVVDEYGGTAGMVTLEDLVEEIVGEVADEHDRTSPGVLQTADGRWFLPGLLRPDEATDQIPRLKVPEGNAYETVGGFVMSTLGRLPVVGDTLGVTGGVLRVTRMEKRRVDRLEFSPAPEPSVTDEQADAEEVQA